MNQRTDQVRPYVVGAYRFMVELDGMLVAGFSEVSGLSVETEVEEVAEGGLNQYVHRLPSRTKLLPLTLKRGMTLSNELWNWYFDVIEGKIVRKSGSIILYNERDQEFRRWNFYDAYPTKWTGPEMNATASEVAVEQIELTHNGFKML
ncbi:phage tail protein [Paenibacillus sp. FSL H8-0548]|uniref:phage tail protein n=1 Tax=Paenibacillus sp. FSL H8-0548 TaxID=1920422 RepID=UPI00096D1C2A|nr:phage tail protein [Paenibacillus sp. FSL H8-0548]OMF29369.1 phage tail protein [Paenibacillus sp. FSL H8-0548]